MARKVENLCHEEWLKAVRKFSLAGASSQVHWGELEKVLVTSGRAGFQPNLLYVRHRLLNI